MLRTATHVVPLTPSRVKGGPAQGLAGSQRQLHQQRSLHREKIKALCYKRNTRRGRHGLLRPLLHALIHWASWVLVVVLVASQFTCIVWDTLTADQYLLYGKSPLLGPYAIEGMNDEPYSDRSLVCVLQGRLYKPMQLSVVLTAPSLRYQVVDTTGSSISGYRIVQREEIGLRDEVAKRFEVVCDTLATRLEGIARACSALGYDVAIDNARIVDGIHSNVTKVIANSLPVLILPYWDNAVYARYVMPGVDGSACAFRLSGEFDVPTEPVAWLSGVDRSVRERKTAEWLGIPPGNGATWRNGWLQDPTTGMRWYSDIISTQPGNTLGLVRRQFDVTHDVEVNCTVDSPATMANCSTSAIDEWWGTKFMSRDKTIWSNSVAIANGTRFGVFTYEALQQREVRSIYDLATFLSNSTVAALLFRWLAASLALLNAYRRGYSRTLCSTGIGCLSNTRSFEVLPLILLPRMKTALAAFFTAGCKLEGEQRPFGEAWFAIYPGIAETMLFYYSVLNLVAKALRRRSSDVLFGPSLGVLCLLHFLRRHLANSGWFEFDGRVTSVMSAREFEKLSLVDFFVSDAALRLNGNVWSIFGFKLAVLALNLTPLFVGATKMPPFSWPVDSSLAKVTSVEWAIKVRASDSCGLGRTSPLYETHDTLGGRSLDCYELVRLGYVVYGSIFVVPLGDWIVLLMFAAARSQRRVSSLRVLTFTITVSDKDSDSWRLELEAVMPTLYQHNDPLLLECSVWDISSVPLS